MMHVGKMSSSKNTQYTFIDMTPKRTFVSSTSVSRHPQKHKNGNATKRSCILRAFVKFVSQSHKKDLKIHLSNFFTKLNIIPRNLPGLKPTLTYSITLRFRLNTTIYESRIDIGLYPINARANDQNIINHLNAYFVNNTGLMMMQKFTFPDNDWIINSLIILVNCLPG